MRSLTSIKYFFIILFVILIVSCSRENAIIVTESGTEDTLSEGINAYAVVMENSMIVLDDSLGEMITIPLEDSITSVSFNKHLFLTGSMYHEINLSNFSITSSPVMSESKKTVFIPDGKILMLKNSLLMSTKFSQATLLKSESPLIDVYVNPYHKYVYVLDSLGYLYSIDYENRILKKKTYAGAVKSIGFFRYGSRLYINTDKDFSVCDFETINIIYKRTSPLIAYTETPKNNVSVLVTGPRTITLLNNINYSETGNIGFHDSICGMISNDDSLYSIADSRGRLFVFSEAKELLRMDLNINEFLDFTGNVLVASTPALTMIYIDRDSIYTVDSLVDPLFARTFNAPDSVPSQYTKADKTRFIEEIEKETSKHTFYTVQLHSFTDLDHAKQSAYSDRDKILKNDVFVKKATVKKKDYYRVYAGKFSTREEADNFREYLLNIGFTSDIFVTAIYYENIIR